MVKKSRHHNRYQYIQFHKNTFSVAETRSWILKDAAEQQRLWTPTRPLINYLQWNVSKQTKRSIKSLQNKIKYLLLVKFFFVALSLLLPDWLPLANKRFSQNTRWVESAKLKVRSWLTYTPTSLLEGLAMFTVPFAGWEKLLLSFYLLSLILAADLSIHRSFDRNETNRAASFASWSENADDDYPGAIHRRLFTRAFPGQSRLWKQPEKSLVS